jgi:DNA repair protein RecO (recombination protein O)
MSRAAHRVQLAHAYVLHQRPFRDSSLIVELFAREHGRMTVFARAARGPRSRFAALQPFRPMLLSWCGRGEAPQLTAAENFDTALGQLPARQLLSAFYLNELLLTLTTRHDPHPELFDHYALALSQLREDAATEPSLRQFEARLLDFIGYGLNLATEADTGRAVRAEGYYQFKPGVHGVVLASAGAEAAICGRVLLGLIAATLPDSDAELRQARGLLRAAINHCLEGRELRTRIVARSLVSFPHKERSA